MVLESTTYPGTTTEKLLPLLEQGSGLTAGKDFHLAFSPERVDPGNRDWTTKSVTKVVGGVDDASTEAAAALYSSAIDTIHRVSSPEAAELTKLLENIFRSVNIALVNELAQLCDRMDIDVWEVVEAAATKPFGFMSFQPGPGLGGHCIPIDPFYLTWKAREYGFSTEFIELAGKVNESMPYYCRSLVSQALNHSRQRSLKGSRILVLGIAYKPDISDMRESPAVKIISLLENAGADVAYHDPHVPEFSEHGLSMESVPLEPAEYDCVVIVTDHSSVDYEQLVEDAQLVVDLRNATGVERQALREGLAPVSLRVGQAGLGEWGKNLARNFADVADLAWLTDTADGKQDEFGARYPNARWAESLEEMLEDPALDAVVIATPVPTHYELSKLALEAGKHVFVEKPPAMTASEIDELVAIAEERDLVLMPGHLLLYHPGVRKLKELVDTGELGEVLCVYGNRQNLGRIRPYENALWSLGVHDLSVILYLLDEEPVEARRPRTRLPPARSRGRRLLLPALPVRDGSRTCTCPGSTRTRCGR